ncbi:UNVERIFIED_CONTAM: hypothetical protein HDU68_003021, partial [Siphonaria sp. JEL0065]
MSLSTKYTPSQVVPPPSNIANSNSLSAIATSNLAATNAAGPLTAALIKEYLAARGLNKTLDAFKLEFLQFQKTPPISSRQELAEQLGISKLIKQNKAQDQPLKTQIEIIVKYLVSRAQKDLPTTSVPSSASKLRITPNSAAKTSPDSSRSQTTSLNSTPHIEPLDAPSSIIFKTPLGGFNSSNPRAVSAATNRVTPSATTSTRPNTGINPSRNTTTGPLSTHKTASLATALARENSSKATTNKNVAPPTTTTNKNAFDLSSSSDEGDDEPEMSGQLEGFKMSSKAPGGTTNNTSSNRAASPSPKKSTMNDLEIMDDFDDDEYSITSDPGGPVSGAKLGIGGALSALEGVTSGGALISTQKAFILRKLVFPGAMGAGEESRARCTFTEEWKGKGFCFSENPELAYGTVQIKGGPCGLLASVQAYILKHLLFVEKAHNIRIGKLRPGISQCHTALIDSFTEILWQAGGTRHRRAVVAIYNPNLRVNSSVNLHREKYVPDGITENMQLFEFFDINQLRAFLTANISTFMVNDPSRHGLIQLLYSVILSRGPETIREEDFDEVDCSMIGRHGYCTQEMVNLILMGQAISNVHDGDFKLGEGPDVKVLKGMKKTCQFGYL